MFHLNMHCERISSPRMEIYYVTISLLVQEFIMFSHINKFTKLTFGYTKILERFTIKNWQNQKMEMKIFWRVLWNKTRISPSLSHETQSCTVACDLANKKNTHFKKDRNAMKTHNFMPCHIFLSIKNNSTAVVQPFYFMRKIQFFPKLLTSVFKI